MPFRTAVITAHHLVEGHALFLTPEGWQPRIRHALVATTPEEAEELEALAARDDRANRVTGIYLVEVGTETGTPVPVARRERIRAEGTPTIPFGLAAAPARQAAA